MKEIFNRHRIFWKDREVMSHMLLSMVLIAAALFLNYTANVYTSSYGNGYVVPDILLDNLPVLDVSMIFFQGAFLFAFIVLLVLLFEPKYLPFTLESSALFFIFRSFFMVLTHLSAPSTEYYKYIEHEHRIKQVIFTISSGNDLFFSGHAGYPFLLALIFWQSKPLRNFFLFSSAAGSVAVILGHLHYSIDVFSAFFITYGIFQISKLFFKKEYELLRSA